MTKNPTCGCGCGETVTRQFKQGHDARYAGALVRSVRDGSMQKRTAVAKARKISEKFAAKVEGRLA